MCTPSSGAINIQPSSSSLRPAALFNQLANFSSSLGRRMKRPGIGESVNRFHVDNTVQLTSDIVLSSDDK